MPYFEKVISFERFKQIIGKITLFDTTKDRENEEG